MFKKICIVLIFFIILVPNILALYTTRIDVLTKPNKEVSLKVLYEFGENEGRLIDKDKSSLNNVSDSTGRVTFFFSSADPLIRLSLKEVDDMTDYLEFKKIMAGKDVFIDLTKSSPVPVITDIVTNTVNPSPQTSSENSSKNQSQSNETNLTENTTTKTTTEQSPIQTPVSSKSETNFQNKIIMYLLIVLGLVVLIFIGLYTRRIIKKKHRNDSTQDIKSIKLSEKFNRFSSGGYNDLKEAEKKLREAQDNYNRIKNKDHLIIEAERKLKEDQDRLKKLRGY